MARGYYDLDVPYFGTDYALNQLGLAPELRPNVTRAFYESGHTLYTPRAGREKLKSDVAAFIKGMAAAGRPTHRPGGRANRTKTGRFAYCDRFGVVL